MKIVIMGYSGSGKSTLARKLGEYEHIDVLHLDKVHHLPDWKQRQVEDEKRIVNHFLDHHLSWVIDGNYTKLSFQRRLEEADMIILLLFNRFYTLSRIIKRYLKYRGKSRPDMCEGCLEKIDMEFIKWVLFDGRTKDKKQQYQYIQNHYADKVVILKSQRQINLFERKYKD